mmetsp:Transcript_9835/g.25800  ORF Transcript_9835/g.25800 Transcript_9835/m.25800 type:complete len:280 (+) Transcript_9835:58-897(+)
MPSSLLPPLLALLALFSLPLAHSPSCAGPPSRTVSLSASASATASPTSAALSFAVELRDDSVLGARERAAAATSAISSALGGFDGIDKARHVQTMGFGLRPVFEWRENTNTWGGRDGRRGKMSRVTVGYEVRNEVSVRVEEMGRVAEVLDAVVKAGGDDVQVVGVRYVVDDTVAVEAEARAKAVAKARKQAQELVVGAGGKLGKLVSVSVNNDEYYPPGPPQPMMMMAKGGMNMEMAADAAGPPETALSGGEFKVRVNVYVTYEIEDESAAAGSESEGA